MSTEKIDMKVVETFMTRAGQAARMGSKEIRIPMPEGFELATTIGLIMAKNIALVEQLTQTEALIGSSIKIDGGKFG